jgi:hypothetical protein
MENRSGDPPRVVAVLGLGEAGSALAGVSPR